MEFTELGYDLADNFVLLDTSVLGPIQEDRPLPEKLYENVCGLMEVSKEQVLRYISCLNRLNYFLFQRKVGVISEVFQEASEDLNILNAQVGFLERQEIDEELVDSLAQVRNYTNALNRFVRKIKSLDPRKDFTSEKRSFYDYVLRLADYAFGFSDSDRFSRNPKSFRMKKPQLLGERLRTDSHIVATSFVLACHDPILVLTRDNGLIDRIGKVYGELFRNGNGFEVPQETINCFSLDKLVNFQD